jgi:hypothetical protein
MIPKKLWAVFGLAVTAYVYMTLQLASQADSSTQNSSVSTALASTERPPLYSTVKVQDSSVSTALASTERPPLYSNIKVQDSSVSTALEPTQRKSIRLVPEEDDFAREPVPRPPLDSIVQGWNVTGDASWLLNFAVVGFPKCGTSTLMHHLQGHPEVQIFRNERCELTGNQQVPLIRDLYNDFPAGNYLRGTKCPLDMESSDIALPNYQRFFPKTKFIVGVRHPVLWFESFYNFRVHNKIPMRPAEELVGMCGKRMFSVCTDRGNFHIFLRSLGKTNTTDPKEGQYIEPKLLRRLQQFVKLKGQVFLYEVTQLSDKDEARSTSLRDDLQQFLRLKEPIAPFIWFRPGKNHTRKELELVNSKKIDICEDKFTKLRSTLMAQSVNASRWIREYFVDAEDVFVSSKEHFSSVLMKSWERDPCLDRPPSIANTDTTKTTAS